MDGLNRLVRTNSPLWKHFKLGGLFVETPCSAQIAHSQANMVQPQNGCFGDEWVDGNLLFRLNKMSQIKTRRTRLLDLAPLKRGTPAGLSIAPTSHHHGIKV